jgi:uncharacterized membrane protein
MNINQVIALFGFILACCVFLIMHKLGFPDKIKYGTALLSIIFVAVIWSTANITLGGDDDE